MVAKITILDVSLMSYMCTCGEGRGGRERGGERGMERERGEGEAEGEGREGWREGGEWEAEREGREGAVQPF